MKGTWASRARIARYKRSKPYAHSIDDFRRCCELVFTPKGIHGNGDVEVYPYPFRRTSFDGVWVRYRVAFTVGEPEWPIPLIGIDLAKDFMVEVAATLSPYHEGEPAMWECYGYGVSARGQLKELGEKTLSSARSVMDTTGQALGYIEDWLQGIVYSSSDIGVIGSLWLKARLNANPS